jgi:hypothetical protein
MISVGIVRVHIHCKVYLLLNTIDIFIFILTFSLIGVYRIQLQYLCILRCAVPHIYTAFSNCLFICFGKNVINSVCYPFHG